MNVLVYENPLDVAKLVIVRVNCMRTLPEVLAVPKFANERPDATTLLLVSGIEVTPSSFICNTPPDKVKTVGLVVALVVFTDNVLELTPGAGVLSSAALRTVCVINCIACIPCPSTSEIATPFERVCSILVRKKEIVSNRMLAMEM